MLDPSPFCSGHPAPLFPSASHSSYVSYTINYSLSFMVIAYKLHVCGRFNRLSLWSVMIDIRSDINFSVGRALADTVYYTIY